MEDDFKLQPLENFQFDLSQTPTTGPAFDWSLPEPQPSSSVASEPQLKLTLPSINEHLNAELQSLRYRFLNDPPLTQGDYYSQLNASANNVSNRWYSDLDSFNPGIGTTGGYSGGGGEGFNARIGITVIFGGGKPKMKLTSGIGYGSRGDYMGGAADLNFNIYNYGPGSSQQYNNGWNWDVSASAYLTVGQGMDQPMAVQTLNSDTLSSMDNTFEDSFTYGQLLTFNSGVNQGEFTFENVQRQGIIGLRFADTQVMMHNDVDRFPHYGGATDHGWTGGATIAHKDFAEFSFEAFTGIASDYNENLSQDQRLFHAQDSFQQSFNMGLTRFRLKPGDMYYDFEIQGPLWGQDLIHNQLNIPRFAPPETQYNLWLLRPTGE